jgi:predicted dehydrogenase
VLVEKPIALTRKDADAMLQTAARAGKLLMVAQVLPFTPEFAFAAETIRSGSYGRLLAGHFKRIIAQPDWSADVADVSKTGGPAVDLHIHDTHFIGLIAGVPRKVFSTGLAPDGSTVTYLTTQYIYGPGDHAPALSCSSGALAKKGREFVHGYELYLEKATLLYESGTQPLTVLTSDGKVKQPKLKGSTEATAPFTAELQAAVEGVKSGREPDLLSSQLARDALVLCQKECQSALSGNAVSVT